MKRLVGLFICKEIFKSCVHSLDILVLMIVAAQDSFYSVSISPVDSGNILVDPVDFQGTLVGDEFTGLPLYNQLIP